MSKIALLKTEQNGVEFYTVAATGESGISQSGLAKLCGVTQQTISRLEKTLTISGASNRLKDFVDEALTLTTNDHQYFVDDQEAGNLRVYRAKFCIALIKHYADKGRKEAFYSLMKFAEMGFNTWVQQITGWQSPSDAEAIAELVMQKLAAQTVLPGSQLVPPADRPLFSPAEKRHWERREAEWATRQNNPVRATCDATGRIMETRRLIETRSPSYPKRMSIPETLRRCKEKAEGKR